MLQKYENLYAKFLYKTNSKSYGDGFLEVKVIKYPFHSGLQVSLTDGYKTLKVIECQTVWQVKNEVRKISKQYSL